MAGRRISIRLVFWGSSVKLSRCGCAYGTSTSVDCWLIRVVGLSGFRRARIPSLVVAADARVGSGLRFCARSLLLRASKPLRKSAVQDLTCVR